jgi:hypothetical protein
MALLASVVIHGLTAQAGRAVTLATFADPSVGSPPLFTVNQHHSTVGGFWSGSGLTLETINGTFSDVQFLMPEVAFDASFVTGPGVIEFRALDTTLLLQISFSEARLDNPFSFGATEFLGTGEVVFSGPAVEPPGVVDGTESFSFPFANQVLVEDGYTATASFTSSGDLVPEPATLTSFCLLAVAVARRGRRTS